MHVRIALSLSLIVACRVPDPMPHPDWTEDDTVSVIQRDWDACIVTGTEDTCMARARTLAALLPPTIRPLTPCGALCSSNSFCNSGIVQTCKVCGFGGTCTTVVPQHPAPTAP